MLRNFLFYFLKTILLMLKISFGRKLSEKEAKLLSQLIIKKIQERAKN
jgi:hypothetical protein